MESVNRFINKIFKEYKCYVTFVLIVINLLVYVKMVLDAGNLEFNTIFMYEQGAMFTGGRTGMEAYRLVTAMFLHFDFEHILSNMLMLALIGSLIEQTMGSVSFALVYMLGGIAGNILSYYMHVMNGETVVAAGASGGVFAVSGALVLVFLMIRNRIEGSDTMTTKLIFFVLLLLKQCFGEEGVDNYAHLGGLIAGFMLAAACMIVKSVFDRKERIY